MQRIPLVLAFILGACATAAVQSAAAPEPEKKPLQQPADGPTVTPFTEVPKRRAPDDNATIDMLARGRNAFLGRLKMKAGASVPNHRDPTEEYIHVLQGHGTIIIDGSEHEIGPGTTIYMPADAEVSYQNGNDTMVAIQVFAGPGPASKYEAWKPVD